MDVEQNAQTANEQPTDVPPAVEPSPQPLGSSLHASPAPVASSADSSAESVHATPLASSPESKSPDAKRPVNAAPPPSDPILVDSDSDDAVSDALLPSPQKLPVATGEPLRLQGGAGSDEDTESSESDDDSDAASSASSSRSFECTEVELGIPEEVTEPINVVCVLYLNWSSSLMLMQGDVGKDRRCSALAQSAPRVETSRRDLWSLQELDALARTGQEI